MHVRPTKRPYGNARIRGRGLGRHHFHPDRRARRRFRQHARRRRRRWPWCSSYTDVRAGRVLLTYARDAGTNAGAMSPARRRSPSPPPARSGPPPLARRVAVRGAHERRRRCGCDQIRPSCYERRGPCSGRHIWPDQAVRFHASNTMSVLPVPFLLKWVPTWFATSSLILRFQCDGDCDGACDARSHVHA